MVFWLERAVLCVAVLYLCVHSLPKAWRTLNTDFPNYYMAARLVHEGYDTSRMYEWTWIEREKDHRGVDERVIGLLPITPFSTLAVWPIAELKPLTAKHVWIVFNLAAADAAGVDAAADDGAELLADCAGAGAVLSVASESVVRAVVYVAADDDCGGCWCWLRGWQVAAGVLVAVAAGCKVFPALLLVWFLRRRQWRALVCGIDCRRGCVGISVAVFGVAANRTWLEGDSAVGDARRGAGHVRGRRGVDLEVMHGLLLREPQWNPHPWHESVMAYAVLVPLLQMMVLAPAVLLIRRENRRRERVLMEWSALVTAALAVSTITASYNFVLMVFPVCVMAGMLLRRRQYGWLAALAIAYLGIGFPLAVPASVPGLAALLYVPRLWLMLAVLAGIYVWLWRDEAKSEVRSTQDWERYAWAAAMAVAVVVSMMTTLQVESAQSARSMRTGCRWLQQGFLNAEPQATKTGVRYAALLMDGYRLMTQDGDGVGGRSSGRRERG